MIAGTIALAASATQSIREHGSRSYPQECCGALLGRISGDAKEVVDVIALKNVRKDNRERRFLVDDADYLRVEREAERRRLTLLGFYHSHPDHPAEPSATDLAQAFPWFSTLILSVQRGEPERMTSWILTEDRDRFLEERVVFHQGAA